MRENDSPASQRYVSAFGRDVDVPETALHYEPAIRRLTLAEGSRRDSRASVALDAVLDVLHDGPLTGRGIERAMTESAFDRSAIRDAIELGVSRGSIEKHQNKARGGGFKYAITGQVRELRTTAPAHSGSAPSASIERRASTQFEEVNRAGDFEEDDDL